MNTHIDQLAQWYADAERITDANLPRIGDTLIFPYNAGGYAIEVEEDDWAPNGVVLGEVVRILRRAPKPKPAWHDAVAVMAETRDDDIRRAFVPQYDTETGEERVDTWADWQGAYDAADLIDPAPLIEAKVTDEMVARAMAFWDPNCPGEYDADDIQWAREFITAALGLEAE